MLWELNLWAVLVAAASSFLLGGLWYSPVLFGAVWNRENGSPPQTRHPAMVFGVAFVWSMVAALAFAHWLGPAPALKHAVIQGAIVGACFVGASFGINYRFAQRSATLFAIDAGYHTLQFTVFGLILGLWH